MTDGAADAMAADAVAAQLEREVRECEESFLAQNGRWPSVAEMGKVDEDTVQLLREQFKALDADASGELDADDLELLRRACDQMSSPVR